MSLEALKTVEKLLKGTSDFYLAIKERFEDLKHFIPKPGSPRKQG